MKDEIGNMNYRKLLYFFENKKAVHFVKTDGIWQNGMIEDLNEKKLTLVLNEFKQGMTPILLEDIDTDSISLYKIGGEKK
jgi:hypothetical protein